jgi:hypothetical protein
VSIINQELIKRGLELELSRRKSPLDSKGHSINYDDANKEYEKFILMHGYIFLKELEKLIKE